MTFNETEDKTLNTEIEDVQPVTEEAEPETALDDSQIRAAALAYARFLMDNDIELGEKASSGSGDPGENTEEAPADAEEDAKPQEETAEGVSTLADVKAAGEGEADVEGRTASEIAIETIEIVHEGLTRVS